MPSESGVVVTTPGQEKLFPVEILDRSFHRLERGYGELRREVPPGLYVVRCDMGGALAERLVKVQEGRFTEVTFAPEEVGRMPSAAPVPGSESCHEYYTYPAMDASSQPRQTIGKGARLVLFGTRLGGMEAGQPQLEEPVHFRGLELLNERLESVSPLPGPEAFSQDDRQIGRAAWSFELNPGGYVLSWMAEDLNPGYRALQPLWLAPEWTVLVFAHAPRRGGLLDRRSVSLQMSRGPFDPYHDPSGTAAELALASLRSGRRQLSDADLHRLLQGKFDNPMLGLLGAHMLLEHQNVSRPLLIEVLGNLQRLLGPHPDVAALEIMARRRFPNEGPLIPPTEAAPEFPPVLRAGLTAALDAEWDEQWPARLGALDPLARSQLTADGPWTFFWQEPMVEFAGPSEPRSTRTASPIGAWLGGLAAPVVRPFVAGALEHLAQNLRGLASRGASHHAGDDRLQTFVEQLLRTKGIDALRQLKPEHLRWTGMSPRDAAEVIRGLQSLPTQVAPLTPNPPNP